MIFKRGLIIPLTDWLILIILLILLANLAVNIILVTPLTLATIT